MLLESFICLFGTYFSSPLLQKPGALITMKFTAQVMEEKKKKENIAITASPRNYLK